jgi:GxxExxY protein
MRGIAHERSDRERSIDERIIGLAIDIHRHLGPRLLESAYEECLAFELMQADIAFERQIALPVVYKSVRLDCAYRLDLKVENRLIIEVKSVERLMPIHDAQLITYLRLTDLPVGLLLNFNTNVLKNGIRRLVNSHRLTASL